MVHILQNLLIIGFSGNFEENFRTACSNVSKVPECLVEWNVPRFLTSKQLLGYLP